MIHLCLVSDQPVPNMLPIINPETKPDKVILATSSRMAKKADWLGATIQAHQIPIEKLDIPDPYDLPALVDLFCSWIDTHSSADIALNITGGTKPMAIAAQEAFRMAGKPVFYVNIENDHLIWLDHSNVPLRLNKPFSLRTFFAIHGYTLMDTENKTANEYWMTLADDLVGRVNEWGKALSKLNAYAMHAKGNQLAPISHPSTCPHWEELLESLFYNEVITDRKTVRFRNEAARSFANGGWLEDYVYRTVRGIPGIQQPLKNVIIQDAEGLKNEFDVACLLRNRLFIVECKTKRLSPHDKEIESPAADAIYKLDSLRKIGGLRTKCILVSYLPIRPTDKRRAEENNITVIDQSGLSRLRELLGLAFK